MKKLLIFLLCCCAYVVQAQVYNNEWIDFSKAYFKIKVGKTGLHRIAKTELAAAGLATIPVEYFQLWRNGAEVPIYTTAASGLLPEGGYLEFWGERNDGKGDKQLYRRPEYQLNDRYSLQTDTSVYFLTINKNGNNKRLVQTSNNLTGNTLTPEPYFMYRLNQSFNNQLNGGNALDLDQYLYSAAYDLGEGYCSAFIGTNGTNAVNVGNLFVAGSGPAAQFKIAVAGNRNSVRRYRVKINNDSIAGNGVDFFNAATDSVPVPLSIISSATNNVQVTNITTAPNDRLAIYKYELTYPRQFNFGNAANFEFELSAGNAPRYLEISNFNNGGQQPVLLDRINGLRIIGDISIAGKVRFIVPPLPQPGSMVLYSQAPANLTAAGGLVERRFTNYSDVANEADYLIISNQLLFDNSGGVNAVEQYAQYRRSVAGGSYNVRIYDVEELVDQFGFGIKKTPLGIRNFILFALNRFAAKPKQVLLMGKGTVYTEQRFRESDANINRLNLVPTFGNPASDILLAAAPGTAVPLVSIGRLSVVAPQEILDYLEKVKGYEAVQADISPDPTQMAWKKNVAHIIGSGDPNLQRSLESFMSVCKGIIADTTWGARVHTFAKQTGSNVEQISDKALEGLFEDGMSMITYFGHSSNSGLDYNLDNPDAYNNTGKYPLFTALGCNAGGIFGFNTSRFAIKDAISERYVLAPQKGTIGFIANSHFGIVGTLQHWTTQFYEGIARQQYGSTIGELMSATAINALAKTANGEDNYIVRVNIEETILHGDPALRLNKQPKPDYVITDAMVKIEPGSVSVADTAFKLMVDVQNGGKAIKKDLILSVKRQYPDNLEKELFRDSIAAPALSDSYEYSIPVDGIKDGGMNRLTVTIDAADAVEELFESNNSVSRNVFIYEEEAKPVYPYNFSIVTKPDVKLSFSTANPLIGSKAYQVEMDTTELFNSTAKWSQTINSIGGLIEVAPGVMLRNNTVYYWRVAVVPDSGGYRWNNSSFVYLQDGDEGFSQGHLYQHLKSSFSNLVLDSTSRKLTFGKVINDIFIRHAMFFTATGDEGDVVVNINGASYIRNTCSFGIIFNVFDGNTFQPMVNNAVNGVGMFGSVAPCAPTRINNFEFSNDSTGRRKALTFLKSIPEGSFVVARNQVQSNPAQFQTVTQWIADRQVYGQGNTLYDFLKESGFSYLDSVTRQRVFIYVFQKGNKEYASRQMLSAGMYDKIILKTTATSSASSGNLLTPRIGPAKAWKDLIIDSDNNDLNDVFKVHVLGIRPAGQTDTLIRDIPKGQRITDVSGIDARAYPYLQVMMIMQDTVNLTPYQFNQVRLTHQPLPEGAVAPNILFQIKDTLEVGEELTFKLAFKNVSTASFDSLRVKMMITDSENRPHEIPLSRLAPLNGSDTVQVHADIDTKQFPGLNTLYVQVNAEEDQPEQFSFNNFLSKPFYIKDDKTAPVVDVTFDNVRILDRDIVSAKPDIMIKLTDESKKLLLNDTSLLTVKVRNLTTQSVRTYKFDNDTLRFVPATQASQNVASVNFKPYFSEDGEYELLVTGKDRRGNEAGGTAYRVSFQVINKPMISNMLNYPNPFTTATAFVFTLTGSEVPQNLKIQILTITGKIVREITRPELGSLRIGRNITEFKWDGTDQFGQKLANGVYLYRVVAQLNGKGLDKYKAANDQTDQYFNKGYGKMYLMR